MVFCLFLDSACIGSRTQENITGLLTWTGTMKIEKEDTPLWWLLLSKATYENAGFTVGYPQFLVERYCFHQLFLNWSSCFLDRHLHSHCCLRPKFLSPHAFGAFLHPVLTCLAIPYISSVLGIEPRETSASSPDHWHRWDWKRFITSPGGLSSLRRSE